MVEMIPSSILRGNVHHVAPPSFTPKLVKTLSIVILTALASSQLISRNCGLLPFNAFPEVPSQRAAVPSHPQSPLPTDDFQLAFQQSYGFFDDISSAHWARYQQRFAEHHDHLDPNRPNPASGVLPALFYMNHYDPIFTCAHPRRLGGLGDGPKWTCDPHRLERVARERLEKAAMTDNNILDASGNSTPPQQQTNCLVYSVGSAGKYEWEIALAKSFMQNNQTKLQSICEIHVFDFSRDYTVVGHAELFNIHFHQWGLKSSYDNSLPEAINMRHSDRGRLLTLPEMMEKLGHSNHVIDILKVDCEFCEWFAYQDWLNLEVRQLLLETHNLPTPLPDPQQWKDGRWFPVSTSITPAQFFDDIERAGFVMFSKEPNIHPRAGVRGIAVLGSLNNGTFLTFSSDLPLL
jgi:Methyltransferase domain